MNKPGSYDLRPTYRCTGRNECVVVDCPWVGYDEASALAHHKATNHECEPWDGVTPPVTPETFTVYENPDYIPTPATPHEAMQRAIILLANLSRATERRDELIKNAKPGDPTPRIPAWDDFIEELVDLIRDPAIKPPDEGGR